MWFPTRPFCFLIILMVYLFHAVDDEASPIGLTSILRWSVPTSLVQPRLSSGSSQIRSLNHWIAPVSAPRPRQLRCVEEMCIVSGAPILVADPHPPITVHPEYRRIDSRKPIQQNCFDFPLIGEAQAAIKCNLVGLMLLGNAEQLALVGHQLGIGKMPR